MSKVSKRNILRWMGDQQLHNYIDDGGEKMYTELAQDCSYHFDFSLGSEEDELCFELSIEILDRYFKLNASGF